MASKSFRATSIILFCACGLTIAQTPPNYTVTQIGLIGPNYTYIATDGYTNPYSEAYGLNAAGQAVGYSNRYDSSGDSLGEDVWIESNGLTQAVGLTGNNYSYPVASGTYQYSSLGRFGITIDPAGQFFGETNRYDASGNTLGFDAWFYNGSTVQQVGLIGPGYIWVMGGGVYEYSEEAAMNNVGQAIGSSERYNSSGNFLGDDSWFFSGGATIPIGLTGGIYSYNYTGAGGGGVVQISMPGVINDAGDAIGSSNRFTSTGANLGQDSWFFNGATSQEVGLVGPIYSYPVAGGGTFEQIIANRLNSAGDVTGVSMRYNSLPAHLGQDAWIFNGTTTQQIGLTGSQYQYTLSSSSGGGIYEQSGVIALSNAGQAIGESYRFNSAGSQIGSDAWLFDGTTTRQIGLVGPGYSFTSTQPGGGIDEDSIPTAINNAGKIIGGSSRYASNGAPLGGDAWFYNGSTTQAIGLSGPGYSYSSNGDIYQSSGQMMINNNPDAQVLGISHRYGATGNSLGQAAWFFDSATGITTPLLFSTEANGYGYTEPMVLTNTGVVLGYYDLFSASNGGQIDAFYWSEQYGFYDLGALVNGSISAAGVSDLTDADFAANALADGSPQFILAYGEMPNSEGVGVFLMNAVPEPTPFACATIAIASVFQRKRQR